MSESNLEVAMIDLVCRVCGKKHNSQLLLNTILNKKEAAKVKEMHGTAMYSDEPCPECKKDMEIAFLFIVCDMEKTGDDTGNPFRTGEVFGIKKEVAKEMIDEKTFSKGACFVDYKDAAEMGFPTKYIPT